MSGHAARIAALACGAVLWFALPRRAPTASHWDLLLLWLLSIGLAVVASAIASRADVRICSSSRLANRGTGADYSLLAAIAVLALLARVLRLDTIPYAMGGDEGSQAMSAVDVVRGALTNPFATGWYSTPTLAFFVQAGSIAIFGDSVGGVRAVSALVGTATVIATYFLVRRLSDNWTAAIAALILAVFHYHLHFSRLASMQIFDAFFVVLLLLFLDRSLEEGRPTDWLAAGVVLAMSQYFYFGARVLPLLWLAAVAHGVLTGRATGGELRWRWLRRRGLRLIGWTVLGAALTYLPLLSHYIRHPTEYSSRINQVSVFASGWLANEQQVTGRSAAVVLIGQIRKAVLLPFLSEPRGWYRGPGVPFAGIPLVPFVAVGLCLVSLRSLRSALFPLAAAFWGSAIGLGLTDEAQTQRAVITAPLIAIFAAFGLAALRSLGERLPAAGRRAAVIAMVAMVAVIVGWNLRFYFFASDPISRYADGNTLAATELARYLRAEAPQAVVYLAGEPRLRYDNFQSIPFIARSATVVDLEPGWGQAALPDRLSGPTVFAFLPERVAELMIVRERFPRGRIRKYHWIDGSPLLVLYRVEGGAGT